MANFTDAFQPEGGINLDDLLGIFAGSIDPSVTGEDAPVGSLFIRSSGQLYQKVNTGLTDWIVFSQGLGEAVKISATDTNAGYLNSKLLVSASIVKTIQNGGANETLTLDLANVGTPGTYRSVTTNAKGQVTAGTNPTTLTGYGITDAQPLDTTLTSLAAYNTNGILTQTAPDTFVGRTVTGTTNQITVTNGNGVSGNPTLSFPSTTLTFPGTAGVILPRGTTAQRIATTAYTRFNNDTSALEYFNGTVWVSLVASTGGTVTSVAAVAPAAGLTVSGSPITTNGTLTFALANDLAAVEGLTTTGIAVRTGADTWATRTLAGATDRITITNDGGVAGNPTIDIAATYAGQASITTVGNVATGTWSADTISTGKGGTGRTTIGSANQVLGVNTTGTALEYKTITAGAGINAAFAGGSITLSNTGVVSIAGTANQVVASAATGAVTLSLPQSIGTASAPTFASVTVAADPTLPLQLATKQYVDAVAQGIDAKDSVRVATTGVITLSGLQTIDGVALAEGDRVLVRAQGMGPIDNGIYIASAGAWTRSADADTWNDLVAAFVFVEEGTLYADTGWLCQANAGGVLGTNFVQWVQFSSAGVIEADFGLTKSGNVIFITNIGTAGTYNNVTTNSRGQVISGSNVAYLTGNQTITLSGDVTGTGTTAITTTLSNTGIAAGTYRSLTIDAKGRATAGTNPTTLAGYGITDAQPLDSDLTALASTGTTGLYAITGPGTSATRTLVAGSSRISLTNANGVAGNPTIDVAEANLTLNNIGGTLGISKGGTNLTTLGAPNQMLGVNSAGTGLEYKTFTGTGITITHSAGGINFSAVNNGTVTSVSATGSTGLSVSGSPITTSGTLTFTLGAELQGLSTLSTNGLIARTAAGTYAPRSIVSGVGTITITNPAGTAGNIGLDLTTVGTSGTYRSVTTDAYGRVTAGTNPTTIAGYGITDAVNTSALGAANGVATLDAGGRLTLTQLPATAITDTFVVATEVAQLALTAEVGDVAVRTDLNKSFILRTSPASVLANWQELLTPTDTVLSVNGQTGIVSVGTVTSVNITAPAAGITVSGGPVTSAGSITLALANDLAAVENLGTVGLAVRTGTNTWATRSLVAGAGISITNPTGAAGDITIAATGSTGVTSVGLSLPSIFTVTGSPVTGAGTLTGTLASQSANTIFAAPSGAAGAPSFRTISLIGNDVSDVQITAPQANQVLAYNSGTSRWVNTGAVGANAAGLIGVGQSGAAAWTLVSGTRYRADFAHNLGTTNVVITIFDTATNAVVIADSTVLTSNNNVRVTVVGNTRTLRVVVVANGQSIVAGGSTPSSVIVSKDGVTVGTTTTRINFTGQAVGVTDAGSGTTNVNVGARYSYFANSLDTPNTADFVVNALAPVTTDPSFNSLNVRSFSNTVEQGVGFTCSIPAGATSVTFKFRGRATTAPGVASVVQPRLYARLLPNNSAVTTWSAANELANITIPTNAFFQYAQQTVTLASLGLTADRLYQFELTRRVAGVTGTNLASAFLLAEVTVEFS